MKSPGTGSVDPRHGGVRDGHMNAFFPWFLIAAALLLLLMIAFLPASRAYVLSLSWFDTSPTGLLHLRWVVIACLPLALAIWVVFRMAWDAVRLRTRKIEHLVTIVCSIEREDPAFSGVDHPAVLELMERIEQRDVQALVRDWSRLEREVLAAIGPGDRTDGSMVPEWLPAMRELARRLRS